MKTSPLSRKCRDLLWILVLALVLGVAVSALRGYFALTVSCYTLTSDKLTEGIRVVHLSDLHNREFGPDNCRLLERVAEQKPDLIFVTGDCVTRNDPERQAALELLGALTELAPVYLSLGNHEVDYDQRYGTDLCALYRQTGVTVLDRAYADITVNGQTVRVGGIYGYCYPTTDSPEEGEFLREFAHTPRYTFLLCHRPVAWMERGALETWQVDSVYAGHAHGGQLRLPFIGSAIAPDQGLFPGWVEGVHYARDGKRALVISRGLGSSVFVPRVFNDPELVVVDILPAD